MVQSESAHKSPLNIFAEKKLTRPRIRAFLSQRKAHLRVSLALNAGKLIRFVVAHENRIQTLKDAVTENFLWLCTDANTNRPQITFGLRNRSTLERLKPSENFFRHTAPSRRCSVPLLLLFSIFSAFREACDQSVQPTMLAIIFNAYLRIILSHSIGVSRYLVTI
ncbi:hypothetical protein AcV5_000260 [Taiwanofungus camphoratus]|nr:hypothetical protein AcV5_000260 [Antrodia cinnamomea]